MNPDEARKVRRAASIVVAYRSNDTVALDRLLFDHLTDPPSTGAHEATEGLALLAVTGGRMLAEAREDTFATTLAAVPRRDEQLIYGAPSRWDRVATQLERVHRGRAPQPAADLDMAVVMTTCFDISLALLDELAQRLHKTPGEMAGLMAEAAAQEA